jgi:ABC-type iron transport system FetAB ATPase subunit
MKGLSIRKFIFHGIGPVELEIAPSECIGICGPSGAGKSLFLRALADMDPREAGEIFLDGTESSDLPAPEWRRRVGLLPAESAWWYDTVGEHFPRIDEDRFHALGFDSSVRHWEIRRLSSGERQRLALLRLLAGHPAVLLLDEPTANLDTENANKVEQLIATYQHRKPAVVIWVSHDLHQLNRVADHCFVIKNRGIRPCDLSADSS